ncbi:uncharacterized protein LOC122513082 isoform X1 [Leptopilina heterotoma]|uniref:uncharacterized protein LOC122513082 isoform X1 n=1 Tax=Leptopilina heterotoma TaxID=63436 RepID=UPI001CAA0E28|nr:uncharacterized protein LOC122513082 isoform X1 [Leptopilina heterotoma]
MASTFEKGTVFQNYEEFEQALQIFEEKERQKFSKRSSRTVEAARKFLKKPLNPQIKYYELHLACIAGGVPFASTSKGLRDKGTMKVDCPAHIQLRASEDGSSEKTQRRKARRG